MILSFFRRKRTPRATSPTEKYKRYVDMLMPVILSHVEPVLVHGFDIVNPESAASPPQQFSFTKDLVHVIGVVDREGRRFELGVRDPVEFTHEMRLEWLREVPTFEGNPYFTFDVESGMVAVRADDE